MKAIWTILLLIASNLFMTFAWYGHLKLQEMKISNSWPLIIVILFSWGVAFFEYIAQVPANRIGFEGNGGNKTAARAVGKLVAERCKAKGIDQVVFDRGGYLYHGRVAELAEGAREGGLEF